MPGLLIGSDQAVASWCYRTIASNIYPVPPVKAIGILNKEEKLVGAILFENYNGCNLELSVYTEPRTLTVGVIRHVAMTALTEFKGASGKGIGRLTTITSRRNKRLIRALMKIGFRLEGMQRCFYGTEDNKKNTGVRLVAFREQLSRVAFKTTPEKKNAI